MAKGIVKGVHFPADVIEDMKSVSSLYFNGKFNAAVIAACRKLIKQVSAEQKELLTKKENQ
jgi:hypothetical protein